MKFQYHVLSDFRHNIKNSEEDLDPHLWLRRLTREYNRRYNYDNSKSITAAFFIAGIISIAGGLTLWQMFEYSFLAFTTGNMVALVAAVVVPLLVTAFSFLLIRYDALMMHMEKVKGWKDRDFRGDNASELDQLVGVINCTNDYIYYDDDYDKWSKSAQCRAGEDPEDYVTANEAQEHKEPERLADRMPTKRRGNGIVIEEPSSKKDRFGYGSLRSKEDDDDVPLLQMDSDALLSMHNHNPTAAPSSAAHSNAKTMASIGVMKEEKPAVPLKSEDDLFMENHVPKVDAAYERVNRCFNHRATGYNEGYVSFSKKWGIYNAWNRHISSRENSPSRFPGSDDFFDKYLIKEIDQKEKQRGKNFDLVQWNNEEKQQEYRQQYPDIYSMIAEMKEATQHYSDLLTNAKYQRILKERRKKEQMAESQRQHSLPENSHSSVPSYYN